MVKVDQISGFRSALKIGVPSIVAETHLKVRKWAEGSCGRWRAASAGCGGWTAARSTALGVEYMGGSRRAGATGRDFGVEPFFQQRNRNYFGQRLWCALLPPAAPLSAEAMDGTADAGRCVFGGVLWGNGAGSGGASHRPRAPCRTEWCWPGGLLI